MHDPTPADWQLPPGVNRGLWDYVHDPAIAENYDAGLAGAPLFAADQAFVERHCQPPGRLLDLGCGTGRLLVALAARGYRVVGVDLSGPMLEAARAKAAAAGADAPLIRAHLVELTCPAPASFDFAALHFRTPGLVLGPDAR